MRRISRALIGLLIAILVGISAVAATPTPAEAKVGNVRVANVSGGMLTIWCSYGKESTRRELFTGQNSQSKGKCDKGDKDTDQIRSDGAKRCMYNFGVSGRNGWFWIARGDRVKVDDLSNIGIHKYDAKKCGERQWTRR